MEAHPDDRLSVAQVAQAIGVTTRMLEYSFADVMGVSPKDYLKMVRLNAARRALRVADPRTATVAEIAMDHGFWHLGRFSAYYSEMFGKSPPTPCGRTLRSDDGPLHRAFMQPIRPLLPSFVVHSFRQRVSRPIVPPSVFL